MPDMFGASDTVIAGRARIGDATIKVDDNEIPAMNVQIQYQEQLKPQPLPGGEVFLTAQQPQGQIQIGALLHDDFLALLDTFGDMDDLVDGSDINELVIEVDSGITVEETSETEAGNMYTGTEITATGVKITQFGMQLNIENVLLQTNVQIFALNIDKPSDYGG